MYSRSREMDRAIKATFTIVETKMIEALANKKYIALIATAERSDFSQENLLQNNNPNVTSVEKREAAVRAPVRSYRASLRFR